MARFSPEKFLDFVDNHDKDNKNQREALLQFASEVAALNPDLLADEAGWVKKYRTRQAPKPAPAPVPGKGGGNVLLKVPYFSQRDNYRDASRTCFSSSCAMLAEFLKPGTLPGAKGDDKYVQEVFKRGDSTSSSVQIQTLRHFGVSAKFVTNMRFSDLDSLLDRGIPVPIGILHKGPPSAPSGGGHWLTVIGREIDHKAPGGVWYIVNDPWGEINHATGAYDSTNGKGLKYSRNLLSSRWTVEGNGSGWGIVATK